MISSLLKSVCLLMTKSYTIVFLFIQNEKKISAHLEGSVLVFEIDQ
jgi:hypothetical protein